MVALLIAERDWFWQLILYGLVMIGTQGTGKVLNHGKKSGDNQQGRYNSSELLLADPSGRILADDVTQNNRR